LLFACTGYALFRGGWPERRAAIAILAAVLLTASVYVVLGRDYLRLDLITMLIDAGLLVALVQIALTSDRFWPIPMASLHMLALAGHLCRAIQPDMEPIIYKILIAAPIYPMLILLAWGTNRHSRRMRGRPPKSFRNFFPNIASRLRRASPDR
jgi:multisubunit Na+/H+ antiporter MnhC subunit